MPVHLSVPPTFGQVLRGAARTRPVIAEGGAQAGPGAEAAAGRGLVGMWVCSGSPLVAEICAGAGLDWLLVDGEHAPLSLESIQRQLQAIAAYPVTPVVRVPVCDRVLIKQYLDLGAQNILVPMVETAAEAAEAVAATRYPPEGVRGVGSALARAARWNRVDSYLARANSEHVSVLVQIETARAVDNALEIASTPGVDGVFVGPSDLAASMGLIGEQTHPRVRAAVERAFAAAREAGVPVGVNAFDPRVAEEYLDAGVDFILVGADVALLARGSEAFAQRFIDGRGGGTAAAGSEPGPVSERPSY